jgi:hypothetical protein
LSRTSSENRYSALWHGGGANTSEARRFAFSCAYCWGWMRQQENLQLGIARETARRFPRRGWPTRRRADFLFVIPGRRDSGEPESISPSMPAVRWIPGSRQEARPGMTTQATRSNRR